MKPVRIFRHIDCEGPAYFQTLLEEQAIPFELIRIDAGEPVNSDLSTTSGLLFMGGSMSVNDPLDWVAQEIQLIRDAMLKGIPVMGICLGSQLMARAMGSRVYPGPCMELGWYPVHCPSDSHWTNGLEEQITVFHWHGETFDLPAGATRLFSNERFLNQGFAIGPHLALQFHLEMEPALIEEWLDRNPTDLARRCVQADDRGVILAQTSEYIDALQAHARELFNRWLAGCGLR